MQESTEPVSAGTPFSELSTMDQALTVGTLLVPLIVFALFFYFFFWKLIRAQLRAPEELAGIRKALERIADKLESR